MHDLNRAPTREELEQAYTLLLQADVTRICDLSIGAIVSMVPGSPAHEPTRYSGAEVRMAKAVLILRARLAVVEAELAEARSAWEGDADRGREREDDLRARALPERAAEPLRKWRGLDPICRDGLVRELRDDEELGSLDRSIAADVLEALGEQGT